MSDHPFHIEAPEAAMHLAMAINRIAALLTQSIENNDPVLAGACLATLSEWTNPAESKRAVMMAATVFCPEQLDEVGDRILEMCADDDSAVQQVEAVLYDAMGKHFEAVGLVRAIQEMLEGE